MGIFRELLYTNKSLFQRYQQEFGFTMPDRRILVSDIRVRGIGKTEILEDHSLPQSSAPPQVEKVFSVTFNRCMTVMNLKEKLHIANLYPTLLF